MNIYLQSLLDYIQKEKITFREEGKQPCLDSIWWHYGECYNLDSPAVKEGFRNLREQLDSLSTDDSELVITEVGCLCGRVREDCLHCWSSPGRPADAGADEGAIAISLFIAVHFSRGFTCYIRFVSARQTSRVMLA